MGPDGGAEDGDGLRSAEPHRGAPKGKLLIHSCPPISPPFAAELEGGRRPPQGETGQLTIQNESYLLSCCTGRKFTQYINLGSRVRAPAGVTLDNSPAAMRTLSGKVLNSTASISSPASAGVSRPLVCFIYRRSAICV